MEFIGLTEMIRASKLAISCLESLVQSSENLGAEDYCFLAVEQLRGNGEIWRFTFKPASIMGSETTLEAAGGEIFVHVDARTSQCTVLYGE